MSLTGSEKKFTQRPLIPVGNNGARCYSIIDLGTQKQTFKGETKEVPQVMFSWEFPDFMHVFDEQIGVQPLVTSQKYTVALGSKAKLFKMLSSWRNTKEVGSGKGFLKAYLNQWCLVSIVHNPNKTDPSIKYSNIGNNGEGITSMPVKMKDVYKNSPPMNPLVYFDFDEFTEESFNKVPEWIQKIIKESPEWKKIESRGMAPQTSAKEMTAADANLGGIYQGGDNDSADF